ncbi:hypothetical protein Tco_0097542 [Tanacetum coccineum]
MRNNVLRTELEYFSEDYDEEREMEPRPEPTRAATPPLRVGSPRPRRGGERTMGFEGNQSRWESRVERNIEWGEGLLEESNPEKWSPSQALPNNIRGNLPSNGSVAPFVRWIEDYPLIDGLEMPSHIGSYNGKRDLDNFLHLFKGAIQMQKWLMPHTGPRTRQDIATSMHKILPQDYGHETNQCQELKHQIVEAVKSGQLAHLVKGVKEKKEKTTGEQSWPLGEIPLEVTIGEGPITVMKTLTFVIVKSDSPHNLLLGRTAMQQIRIVVSTVYGAIKFHTPRGIGTIFSEYNSQKPKEEEDGPTNKHQGNEKNVLSCIDTEERMVINDKYPEQKIAIGRQLPTRTKIRLRDLLKRYINVFAWTSAYITGVPRVLMIGGETFNTEHRINMFNHVEPVKQKKRSLAPEKNEAIHSQIGKKFEGLYDDMVIKSDSEEEMMADITETLERLRAINLKLNSKKMSFKSEEGYIFGPSLFEAKE